MRRLILLAFFLSAGLFAQQPPARQFLLRIEPVDPAFSLQKVSPEQRPTLTAHAAYLRQLLADGKLVLAGQAFPPDSISGIIIVEAPDAAAAKAILDADPSVKAGLFRGDVLPFRTVFARPPAPPKSE